MADAIIVSEKGGELVIVFFATSEAKVDVAVSTSRELRATEQRNPLALVLERAKPPEVSLAR